VNSWIKLTALWQIVVLGLVAGAGLPALFAVGLLALHLPGGNRARPATAGADGGADSEALVGGSVLGMILAGLCFLVVLAAIGWGIWAIYESGRPAKS
jgi:hypothetical protein